jgi:hypothetical protein
MPFKLGNQEHKKADHRRTKLFRDALLVELKMADGEVERIQRVAAKLIEQAMDGNVHAIKEIADRIDGRVPTSFVGDEDHPPVRQITKVEIEIIDPKRPEAEMHQGQ